MSRLRAVRRRRRLLGVVQALAWTALGAGLLVAASPLARDLTEGLNAARLAARALLVASVVVPLALFAVPAWLRTRSLLRIARAVDDGTPELQASAHTAVDLAAALATDSIAPGPATAHAERHLATTAELAELHIRPERLLPWTDLGRRTLLGPTVAGFALAATAVAPGPVEDGLRRLFAELPALLTDEAPAEVASMELRNLRIQLVPPAYSGRPARDLAGTTGDFQALAGTRVTWNADGPRGPSASVAFEDFDAIDPDGLIGSNDSGRITIDWTVPAGLTSYRVHIPRSLGRDPLRSRAYRVEQIPDRPPTLEVSGPRDRPELRPEDEVRLGVRTGDDFGLTAVRLIVLRRGKEVVNRLLAEPDGASTWDDAVRWRPADDLADGQGGELDLIIESWDNNDFAGFQKTRSRAVEVYVPTPLDRHRQVLELKKQLLDRSVDLLGDLLEDSFNLGVVVARDDLLAEHDDHHAQTGELLALGSRLAGAMAQDRYERREVYLGIGGALANLATVWEPVDGFVQSRIRPYRSGVVGKDVLTQLVRRRQPAVTELERIVLDLASFIDVHLADEASAEVGDLDSNLSELADLVRQAQDGKPVEEELKRAMDELKQALAELAQKLSQQLTAPDDGFLNELPESLQESQLDELDRMLEEGRFEEAMERLQQMMDAMAEKKAEMDAMAEAQAGSQDRDELSAALQEAIDEAKKLEAQQQAVLDDTEAVAERIGSPGLDPAVAERLATELEAAKAKLDEATPQMSGKPASMARHFRRLASQEAARGAEALRTGDLEAATDHARNVAQVTAEMNAELDVLDKNQELKAAGKLGKSAQKTAESVLDELQEAGARDRAQQQKARASSAPLAGRQDQVGDGVGRLQERMEAMESSSFNPMEARNSLQAAGQLMEGAEQRLGDGRPGQAVPGQRDALKQLRQFRESLESNQQAMQPGQRMGGQSPMQAGSGQKRPGGEGGDPWQTADDWGAQGESSADVELSDPDDFVSPEAFRQLLQEGAAGEAPERYKPVNKRYYEELVK